MARPLRVEFSEAFYHVINRGNVREKIYRTNKTNIYYEEKNESD